MEDEFAKAMDDINDADVTTLHEGDNENSLVEKLVRQYLAHEGYIETAKAFTRDTLSNTADNSAKASEEAQSDDDVHAINRQRIRKSILDGDIDRALKYTSTYYPHVLGDDRNKDVYFRLRCRKFIEMMRQYSDLIPSSPSINKSTDPHASSTNGHDGSNGHDTQMELDDQIHQETSDALEQPSTDDVDMDASQELPGKPSISTSINMKQDDLLGAVLICGQELQQEFGGDTRPHVKKHLHDLFAIIAYTNPAESPMGALLDPKGRMQIAEDVNGAILGMFLGLFRPLVGEALRADRGASRRDGMQNRWCCRVCGRKEGLVGCLIKSAVFDSPNSRSPAGEAPSVFFCFAADNRPYIQRDGFGHGIVKSYASSPRRGARERRALGGALPVTFLCWGRACSHGWRGVWRGVALVTDDAQDADKAVDGILSAIDKFTLACLSIAADRTIIMMIRSKLAVFPRYVRLIFLLQRAWKLFAPHLISQMWRVQYLP
nr:ran-binding protein 9 [Quercus suber]